MQILPDQEPEDECKKLKSANGQDGYGSVAVVQSPSEPKGGSTFIEPVLFMFLVARVLSDTVITNLLEYQTCKVHLSLPDENCSEPMSPLVEDLVQPTTANIISGRALIEACGPSFLAVFIGPWSDCNGRKPFLVVSLAGVTISYLCWGALSLVPALPPQMFLLASLPLSLSGGASAIYLLSYCYISDVTDEHSRPFRLSVLALAMYSSSIFGTIFAPLLLAAQHTLNPFSLIFFLTTFLMMMTTLYTHWYIQESVDVQPNREKCLFRFSHLEGIKDACFKQRDGHARTMTLLLVASLMLYVFILEGEGAVMYLSARELFSWQLSDFSWFSSFTSVVYGFGAIAGVWLFHTVLGLSNMPVAALLLISRSVRSAFFAIAQTGFDFYLSVMVSCMSTAFLPICRTEMSKLVSKQDLGKVFALTAFLESVSPVPSTPLYTYVYESTFLVAPGKVFWLSAGFYALCALILTIVAVLQRNVNGIYYFIDNSPKESENTKITV